MIKATLTTNNKVGGIYIWALTRTNVPLKRFGISFRKSNHILPKKRLKCFPKKGGKMANRLLVLLLDLLRGRLELSVLLLAHGPQQLQQNSLLKSTYPPPTLFSLTIGGRSTLWKTP